MPPLSRLAGILVPPLCASCRAVGERGAALCPDCERELSRRGPLIGTTPPGVDRAVSVAEHEGVARRLLMACKFGGATALAPDLGARMAAAVPLGMTATVAVPVPPARLRSRMRGFDLAGMLAAEVAGRLALGLEPCLARRGGGRQRGKGRAGRLAAPPAVQAVAEVPREALLVDDVMTTGATLTACARALRRAGAVRVTAITFTRRL